MALHCIDVARRLSDGTTELSCSCERTFTDTPERSALDQYRDHRADPDPCRCADLGTLMCRLHNLEGQS